MPIDTRRVNGPPQIISLASLINRDKKKLLVKNKRLDGRDLNEVRPIYLKAGIVQKANGSAYIETNGTKLICSVYGPRDSSKRHDFLSTGTITCELTYAPFSRAERLSDHSERECKEFTGLIIEALHSAVCVESYPKAQIDVYIHVLEDNGNTLSYAIVAASVALADAGIEMFDMVTSCSCVFDANSLLLDPSTFEEEHSATIGKLTIAYLPSLNEISSLIHDGKQDVEDSIKTINACIESCLRIHSVMKECLARSAIEDQESKDQE